MIKMKRLVFFILFGICGQHCSQSQKIIAIVFADTNDGKIGNGCAVDENNFRRFYKRLGRALKYDIEKFHYIEDEFNAANFDVLSAKFKSGDNDIILLYNTCHGERSPADETVFPQLKFDEQRRSAYKKHQFLKTLPHKNLITFIDACNNVRNIRPAERELYAKIYDPKLDAELTPLEIENIKRIFSAGFDFITTSSEPGVASLTTKEAGSIFTNCFIAAFNHYANLKDPKLVNIKNIVTEARKETFAESKRIYVNNRVREFGEKRAHTPQFELNFKGTDSLLLDNSAERYRILLTTTRLSKAEKLRRALLTDYKVVITVDNSKNQIADIASVVYFLHDTFKYPEVAPTRRDLDYKYTIFVWGKFLVKAEITLNDGRVINTSEYISFN